MITTVSLVKFRCLRQFLKKMFFPLRNSSLLLLLLSHVSRVRLCVTPQTAAHQGPVPGILQARTLERVAISSLVSWQPSNGPHSSINYSHHVVHCMPSTHLSYDQDVCLLTTFIQSPHTFPSFLKLNNSSAIYHILFSLHRLQAFEIYKVFPRLKRYKAVSVAR